MGASYSTVFNMAWYALKPLPLGKKDKSKAPTVEADGVFFGDYKEGVPGVQPERVGPYCTTFNPGLRPDLAALSGMACTVLYAQPMLRGNRPGLLML